MTKADLVQEISKQTGIDRDEVLMIVEAIKSCKYRIFFVVLAL